MSQCGAGTRAAPGALRNEVPVAAPPEKLPRYAELPYLPGNPPKTAWGLFGADDDIGMFRLQTPERVAAAAHADRLRNTPSGLAAALRGLGTGVMPPLWDRLGELAMPVTLVVGERDAKFREVAGRMAPLIARSQVVVVAGVTLRDQRNQRVLFDNQRMVFRGEYELAGDPESFFNEEDPAASRLAREFAESVVATVVNGAF